MSLHKIFVTLGSTMAKTTSGLSLTLGLHMSKVLLSCFSGCIRLSFFGDETAGHCFHWCINCHSACRDESYANSNGYVSTAYFAPP